MAKPTPPAEPSYEAQLARLVTVVARLETGDLALAEALQLYEEGVVLGVQCQQLLDAAEVRVRQLSNDGKTLEPWSPDD
ncbi:MAG: exodeoxyribonuclease VII small subunit [Herpetosiphonaceae bacterium]|nr:exodeoxyribonuclease VII small subunit [Herpetosiphonaceae bacterium]